MPCYKPLNAWQATWSNPDSGRRPVYFKQPKSSLPFQHKQIPCGRCIGCRIDKSKEWALRITHEASLHENNCFLTLTYNDDNIPAGGTLVPADLQKFIKRLRINLDRTTGQKIKHYSVGEYGSALQRPHYHLCIFNYGFDDKYHFQTNPRTKQKYYRSELLEQLWPFGHSIIGNLTFESAAYVARYCTKKINGKPAADHYAGKQPEFARMSLKPAIAKQWFDKYHSDIYPNDQCIINGKPLKPPRYYDNQFEAIDFDTFQEVKQKRADKALEIQARDPLGYRLQAGEKIKTAQLSKLKRTIEQ